MDLLTCLLGGRSSDRNTNIFYSHTDASYLMEVANLELKKITCWFYTNKLSINVKKSNFIIFRPRQNRQTLDLAFNISNYSIDRVKEATFLGVILSLSRENREISKVCLQISFGYRSETGLLAWVRENTRG